MPGAAAGVRVRDDITSRAGGRPTMRSTACATRQLQATEDD